MSLIFNDHNIVNNSKEIQKEKGLLERLSQYGLGKIKSFSEQIGFNQIGEKTKNLFVGALSVFRKKTEPTLGVIPETIDVNKKVEQGDNEIVVDGIVAYSEMDLYTKLDYLLHKLKEGGVSREDRRKIAELTRGTDFNRNELLDGRGVGGDIQRKSVDLVEDFKMRIVKHLLNNFNGSKDQAKKFILDRFENKYKHNPPHFKLIEKKNKAGQPYLELVSDDFVTGTSTFSDLEKKGDTKITNGVNEEVVKEKQFLNVKKASEALATNRDTLTEQLVSAMEIESGGKIDQADWYEVGGMSANEVLKILRQALNRRIEREQFNRETKRWIENSINIFKPASDETFAEYMERRFMKGDRLPSIYNDVVNVVKIFNEIQNRKNDSKNEVVDRQMIGEMPVEKVFDILRVNKKVKENSGVKFILNHKIKLEKGESLRRYFYRLTAYNRGFLREDGTIDEEKLRNDPDFKNIVQLLIDIIPKINKKRLLGDAKEDIEYYKYYKPISNDNNLSGARESRRRSRQPKEVPYFERVFPDHSEG